MIRTAWSDGAAFCLAILLLISPIVAHAESRAEFDQLVHQLSANPGDTALRERIIKLAQEIKPPPAISEEARRHFIKGSTIAESARSPSEQQLAIASFREALKLAPWWGNAYYNLAVAQELAGQLADAKQSLRFYILSNPGAKEAREAQDKIYALEAKQDLAVTPQATADTEQQFLRSLEGGIWLGPVSRTDDSAWATTYRIAFRRTYYTVRSQHLVRISYGWHDQEPEPPLPPCYAPQRGCLAENPIPLTGRRIAFKTSLSEDTLWRFTVQISEDGRRITQTQEGYGKVISTEYVRSN